MTLPAGAANLDTTTDLLGPILSLYASEAERHLKAASRTADRVLVSPSPPVWDGGCEGQLWSRVTEVVPLGDSPTAPCGIPFWQVTIAVGVIRCLHVVNDRGRPPWAEEITEDGHGQLLDMQILKDAILGVDHTRSVEAWQPLAPSGGMFGGEWTLTARVDNLVATVPVSG